MEAGVTTDAKYTVEDAVNDFLAKGLKGRSKTTIDNYRSLAGHNLIPQIGGIKLKDGRPARRLAGRARRGADHADAPPDSSNP
jgi:hypothetical protein